MSLAVETGSRRVHLGGADHEEKERVLLQQEMQFVRGISTHDKKILTECYVQRCPAETAARLLGMSPIEAHTWYYRFSILLVRSAIRITA